MNTQKPISVYLTSGISLVFAPGWASSQILREDSFPVLGITSKGGKTFVPWSSVLFVSEGVNTDEAPSTKPQGAVS